MLNRVVDASKSNVYVKSMLIHCLSIFFFYRDINNMSSNSYQDIDLRIAKPVKIVPLLFHWL